MNSINVSRRLQRNAYLAATTIVALCCQAAGVIGAEPSFSKSTTAAAPAAKSMSAAPGAPRKLQWQPVRRDNKLNDQPVRTVRYEEDVFADGPALKSNSTSVLAHRRVTQTGTQTPFDEPDPKPATPPPSDTPSPTDTTPTPMPVPGYEPPAFPPANEPSTTLPPTTLPPTTPTPTPYPTPEPMLEPTPSPAPVPFREPTQVPEADRNPDIFLQPPSSAFDPDAPRAERQRINPTQDCETAYRKVKQNTIDKLSIAINIAGKPGDDLPYECALSNEAFDPRCWRLTTYTWKASALCHKPIYFEEEHLERYGHSHGPGCEYLVSAAHFFGNVILLPYHMGVETPCECIYTLGVYRAGSCAPYMLDPFPISLRGAAFGAVGYCGTIALFP